MAEPDAYQSIAVLGAGAWGTALALSLLSAEREVLLWVREPEVLAAIAKERRNPFLPGIALPAQLKASADLNQALKAQVLLLAVPAQYLREFGKKIATQIKPATPLVISAKGIEQNSGLLVHEVMGEVAPSAALAILSGPSFARDVAKGLPTAVTIAARENLLRLQASLNAPAFRPYATDDLAGAALGGAAKNVYAIACGIVEGLSLGENARAAILARGFAELARLGVALGARRETLEGLSGLGDLVLSATSPSSRNFSAGVELGRGKNPAALAHPGAPLAEGLFSAPALVARARKHQVELPIAEAIADLIAGKLKLADALTRLMSRKLSSE